MDSNLFSLNPRQACGGVEATEPENIQALAAIGFIDILSLVADASRWNFRLFISHLNSITYVLVCSPHARG